MYIANPQFLFFKCVFVSPSPERCPCTWRATKKQPEVVISVRNEQIQRRPSSVPSSERNVTKKCKNPREILELFNPDFSDCHKTKDVFQTGSIIQSIREKVFRSSPRPLEGNFPRKRSPRFNLV